MRASNVRRFGMWIAGVAAVLAAAFGAYYFGLVGPSYVPIHAHYAYDVTDARQVFGDASFVAVVQVEDNLGTVEDERTAFRVTVIEQIKGQLPETLEITQDGFRRGNRLWEFADWPLLREGESVLVALTYPAAHWDQDRLHALIGPLDRRERGLQGLTNADLARYRHAVENERFPEGFLAEFEALHRRLAQEWIASHAGYDSSGPAS